MVSVVSGNCNFFFPLMFCPSASSFFLLVSWSGICGLFTIPLKERKGYSQGLGFIIN
jgi:hypothetical protein